MDFPAVKVTKTIINSFLQTAFSKFIAECVFSRSVKIAKVVPVFKAGDEKGTSNYRPISISGSLSTIIEKILHKRLINYLENFSILSDNQDGYRKKERFNTICNFSMETNNRSELESQTENKLCFLDFKKAFYSVDHERLS